MVSRNRDGQGDALAIFRSRDSRREPLTTGEVADALGRSVRSVAEELERLDEDGDLASKQVESGGRVWWLPESGPSGETESGVDSGYGRPVEREPHGEHGGVVLVDDAGEVAWIDRTAADLFDVEREDVVGREREEFVRSVLADRVTDETVVDAIAQDGRETAARETPFEFELRGSGRDPAVRLEYASTPIETGRYAGGRAEFFADVTDRAPSSATAGDRKRLFQSLVEATEEYAVFMLDPDGYVMNWNAGAERINGYEAADIVGEHFSTFYTDDDVEAGVPKDDLSAAIEQGSIEDEGWRVRDDGSRFWANVTITAIRDDGQLRGFAKVTRDMTDRRELEQRLREERNLSERSSNAFFGLDDEWHFTYVNERAEDVLGRDEGELLGANIWDEFEDAVGSTFDEKYHEAMETQEPVHFETYYSPLDGWFEVEAYPSESGLSVYFDNVTERKARERELERYERIVENVPVGVYRNTPGPDGEFVEGNSQLASMFDAESVDELIGSPVSDLYVDPEQRAEFSRRLEEDGIVEDYELKQETLEGRTIWISVTAIRTEEDGDVYFDGVVQDVTERKERERELERYATMFEESHDVNAIIEPDGTYSYLTPSTENVLGYEPEELVGENAFDYIHPDDRDEIWNHFSRVIEDPDYSPLVELRFRHADGSWVVLEAHARNLLDDPQINGIVAYTRDATDRQQFEETLQALNEGSRELIRAESKSDVSRAIIDAASSTLDLPGVLAYRYDRTADALTLDQQSVDSGFMREKLPDFPVDHSSLVGHAFCDGEAKYYDDIRDAEHLKADPENVDMRAGGFVPLGGHGVLVVGWHDAGAPDDRTRKLIEILAANAEAAYARVEREHELEAAEQRYRTLAENFPDGTIALVDQDLEYVTVGGSPRDLTDVTARELEGRPVEEVLEPEIAEELVPRYRRALDGETSQFEQAVGDRIYEFHVIPVRDESGDVFAATGMSQDVTEQVSYQRELEAKARQQEVVADLGQRALSSDDLGALFEEAVELVTETLDSEYCKVLDLDRDAEDLRLRAGIGLPEEYVGSATVDVGRETQAGYTLLADEPIVVEDMDAEERFDGPDRLMDPDVESGISVVIGSRASPWGVLATHDTDSREFSEDDALFVQSVANILANAIDRRDNEVELEEQREHLAALNNLNSVVRDINEALVEQSTREEIERAVCERLADSDSYRFAWTAEIDPRTESLVPNVEAGIDGYLEAADVRIDEDVPEGRGPAGRAARSKDIHVSHDALSDPTLEPWQDAIEEYGFRSCAAIPIVYQDTLYGILGVYTDRVGAFANEEEEVVAQLGEIIGHAIASIERKQALMSDDVVEIDMRMESVVQEAGPSESMEGRVTLTEAVSVQDGTYLQYGTATDGALETVESLVDHVPHWDDLTVLGDETDETGETRFELKLSEPPVVSTVADNGGYIDEAVIEDDTMYITIHLPPTVDVRRVVNTIQESYTSAEMVTRQQVSRTDSQEGIEQTLTQELTDRQRAALEASFHAGFFDWPRESSGEEVAESLDVSAPTFHQHLRKAQRKLLESILT